MNELDKHITGIYDPQAPFNQPDYMAEAKKYFDSIESIDEELKLNIEDFRDVLRENGYSEGEIMISENCDFFDTDEFYELLFTHFEEQLTTNYINKLWGETWITQST